MVATINVDITSIVILFVLVENVNSIVVVVIVVFLSSHLLWRFHQSKSKTSFRLRILRSMIKKTSSNMIRCASHCQSMSFWSRRQRWWRTCGNTSGRPRRIWLGDRHQYHCCHHCFIFINIFTRSTVIIVVIILSSSPLSSSVSLPSSLSSLFYHYDHHHHYHCNHPCHHLFIIITSPSSYWAIFNMSGKSCRIWSWTRMIIKSSW